MLQWGLRPLRKVADEIRAIESGEKDSLSGIYPKELLHLTNNINDLIKNERNHLIRYRNTLGDLAHSLKTPLAVLQGYFEQNKSDHQTKETVTAQLWRMQEIVDYQLQRAAVSGKQTFNKPVEILPVADQIISALDKVYIDKQIATQTDIDPELKFYGEKGDLMEVLGNVFDNAYKWAKSRIEISIKADEETDKRRPGIRIMIEDDGPGIDREKINQITQRGVRGDEREGPPRTGYWFKRGAGYYRELFGGTQLYRQ